MKKVFYAVLAIVVVGIYSCQKDNTTPAKQGFSSGVAAVKGKKDTTPPDPKANAARVPRDTTPPDPHVR
ncbi:MAG: hypothetical protein JKY70_21710 [Mucilaginibacter sp.]|nr:hypothetical protein [Mucilaginibacter sp.]